MQLHAVELVRVDLPVVDPIMTSSGAVDVREILLVRADLGDAEGWGECVAFQRPFYSSEYQQAAAEVLERHLVPALRAADEPLTPERLPVLMAPVKGHRMAKAALESAIVDACLRAEGRSLASWLGGVRATVGVGVSVGIQESLDALVAVVGGYVAAGYPRVKLKIAPGWDVEPVAAVREAFGSDLGLQVDANCAYDPANLGPLLALDRYGMLLIEQPFAPDRLLAHADLARRIETPVCLDESITSLGSCETALALKACRIVNIKLGRVGGLNEARAIHDLCADHGVPVWCGGMLESGVGRAANLALASLPNFTLPGDISASRRYFSEDVTDPFELADGAMAVPTGPGIGVTPHPEALERLCVGRRSIGR
jgi:O-succinylbenzoate synthase